MEEDRDLSTKFLSNGQTGKLGRHSELDAEIELIGDPKIAKFVDFIVNEATYLWEAPIASEFDNRYPPDAYETGGLIKHVKRTVWIFYALDQVAELSPSERDCAIAALLLKECTRVIGVLDDNYIYDPYHLYTVDRFIDLVIANALAAGVDLGEFIDASKADLDLIARLMHAADGNDSLITETWPGTFLQKLVHYSELLAAQAYYLYVSEETDE